MTGVLDLAVPAEGGANEAVMMLPVGLDFQMQIGRGGHRVTLCDGHILRLCQLLCKHIVSICMATFEMKRQHSNQSGWAKTHF